MHNMQADAAAALPADAPVAAYLNQLPQPVSSAVLGEVLAMEAKAVHEVTHQPKLPNTNICHCDEHKVLSCGGFKQCSLSQCSLHLCVPGGSLMYTAGLQHIVQRFNLTLLQYPRYVHSSQSDLVVA